MNSDCNDSPLELVAFLSVQGTHLQQQKHVCALSSGHPLLKWSRPHVPLCSEKGFDHCCQAESTLWKCIAQSGRAVSLSDLWKWWHYHIPAVKGASTEHCKVFSSMESLTYLSIFNYFNFYFSQTFQFGLQSLFSLLSLLSVKAKHAIYFLHFPIVGDCFLFFSFLITRVLSDWHLFCFIFE